MRIIPRVGRRPRQAAGAQPSPPRTTSPYDHRVIPLVDLASPTAAADLASGLATLGFVELKNHGLEVDTMAELRTAADDFFALPPPTNTGRSIPNRSPTAASERGKRRSPIHSARQRLPTSSKASTPEPTPPPAAGPISAADPVARRRTPYRPAAQAALAEFGRLGRRLDTMLGEVLGLPELAARSVNGPDMLACIDYRPGPDGSESVVDGQLRMGAHSDYTTYTLLLADPVPGLQIVGSDGAWIDVIPAAGNLLMNVGDLLAIWTNDAWPSTLHRVVPMALGAAERRRSVAWFHYPDPDVVVARSPPSSTMANLATAPRASTPTSEASSAPRNRRGSDQRATIADRPVDLRCAPAPSRPNAATRSSSSTSTTERPTPCPST